MRHASVGSRNVRLAELDKYSFQRTVALFNISEQKKAAQTLRDRFEWDGNMDSKRMHDWLIEIIALVEPNFETEYPTVI